MNARAVLAGELKPSRKRAVISQRVRGNPCAEPIPPYLRRYADEADAWRATVRALDALRSRRVPAVQSL